jgi:tyrocidine synthetase-3
MVDQNPQNPSSDFIVAADQLTGESSYWLKKLSGEPVKSSFPYDKPMLSDNQRKSEPGTADIRFPPELVSRLTRMSNKSDVRLFMVLVTGVSILLHKYTGITDIIAGIPIYKQDSESTFINTVVALRNNVQESMVFKELVYQVKQTIHEAFQNQNYPLRVLLYDLNLPYQEGDCPLFDVVVMLDNIQDKKYIQHIQPNIIFIFSRKEGNIEGIIQYNRALYYQETIRGIANHFIYLVQYLIANVDMPLHSIDWLPGEEKKKLLEYFNNTKKEYEGTRNKTLHKLFEEQAEKTPGHIALVLDGNKLDYREFNARAQRFSRVLTAKGFTRGSIAALLMESSIEMAVSVMAVLKAGGAYLPIDREIPRERKKYILKDSRVSLLIADKKAAPMSTGISRKIKTIDPCNESIFADAADSCGPGPSNHPMDLAYVIYTSGSTGRPKGVMIEHWQAVNTLVYRKEEYKMTSGDIALQLFSYAFDGFVTSFFTPIISGAAVVLLSKQSLEDIQQVIKSMETNKVTHFICIPVLYNLILDNITEKAASHLKVVTLAGDKLPPNLLEKTLSINKNIEIANEYGITEAAVMSTIYRHQQRDRHIKIGRPAWNTSIYIVMPGNHRQLMPSGVPGEICIGGTGVTRGYMNNPDLTAEKFVNNPFVPGEKWLKTGDIGRWLQDENIQFGGRIDHQVKVRGFRIELGEIERHLQHHYQIKDAVVLARENENRDKQLCAYIVKEDARQETIHIKELRQHLSQTMPDYMIPSFFVFLDKLPLTANGKINPKALPEPIVEIEEAAVLPRNKTEKKLASIWADILGVDQQVIGIDDDFFHLGGHSLNATILTAKIHKEYDVKVSLVEIFENFTIRRLARCIKKAAKDRFISIDPVEKKDYYELSSAQRRLYVLQQMEPSSTYYNVPIVVTMGAAELDIEKIETTFEKLITRHESLRTSIEIVEQRAVQRVHPTADFNIHYCQLEPGEPGSVQKELEKSVEQFNAPFDLSRAPFLRARLINLVDYKTHILLLDMHHIVTDAISMDILKNDFMAVYGGNDLEPLKLQYKDFSHWHACEKQQELIKQQEQYWLDSLAGELPLLHLPTDFERPRVQVFEGNAVDTRLNEKQTAALKKIAKENDMTLYMVILSVFTILLSKLSGWQDIIIGAPIAGRRHSDLDHIMGMFVNTLVMRNYPRGDITVNTFFNMVKERTLEAYENQEYQFDDLVDLLSVPRDTGRNPIFDVMFDFLSQEYTDSMPYDSKEKNYTLPQKILSKFDMTLTASDYGQQVLITLEYCTRLFKKETIRRILKYLNKIVSTIAISNNTKIKLSGIDIMDEEEKNRLVYEFNRNKADYPVNKTIHRLFEEQVEKIPDHAALIGQSAGREAQSVEEKRCALCAVRCAITYKELNEKSDQLAHLLSEKGLQPDIIVAIMVERSVDMIVGIMGILKAGGAYLPIDPGYPGKRINYMLADSKVKILVKKSNNFSNSVIMEDIDVIFIDDVIDKNRPKGTSIPPSTLLPYYPSSPSNLAYVMYTSGSTGRAKGVMVEHRNVLHIVGWFQRTYDIKANPHVIAMASYSFDSSVEDIFGTLLHGGTLFVPPKEVTLEKDTFRTYINMHRINIVNFVPRMLNQFLCHENKLESLNIVISGGEPLEDEVKDAILEKGYLLSNNYGPTEITVDALSERCSPEKKVTLGQPVSNTAIYILDAHLCLVPVGVTGELIIGGDGLARGYLDNPEMTAEKFISFLNRSYKSYRSYISKKIYKTGDLARWLFDGRVEFLGRMDEQVKIRGFRVEPGEIEVVLKEHPMVKEAVVLLDKFKMNHENADTGTGFDKVLAAYVVLKAGKTLVVSDLRDYLKTRLPDFMVPSNFTGIDRIPLTPHGKVDRKALPGPGIGTGSQYTYTAPQNDIQGKLVEIWSEVLNIHQESIGIDANFFELGGHSLRATTIISKIHKELNVHILLMEIFKTPTIREIASLISSFLKNEERHPHYPPLQPAEKKEYYVLSSAQKRLYVLQQMDPGNTSYNMQEINYIDIGSSKEKLKSIFEKLTRRHESLRTSFELINNEAVQRIHRDIDFEIEYYQAESMEQEAPEVHESKVMSIISNFIRPFDLSQTPLLRIGTIKINEGKHFLMVDIHHIISDGVSQTILTNDFMALSAGEKLPELKLHYKDFSQWRNKLSGSGRMKKHEEYWLKEFEGNTNKSVIPTDYPRPPLQSFSGDSLDFYIDAKETARLKELANAVRGTLFMVLLAIYNILISKLGDQEDIIVGTGTAGRRHDDLEKIIGIFINTLALRNYPIGYKTFKEFLGEVKERTLAAFENQDYLFEDLVEKVVTQRDLIRNPLFDTVLMLYNIEDFPGNTRGGGKSAEHPEPYSYKQKTSQFDMMFDCVEVDETLQFSVVYCTDLFKKETIEMFIGCFKQIVTTVIENNDILLKDIALSQHVQFTDTAVPQYDFEF